MRRLILMRHAKAERGSPSGEDFDRPLAARGMRDAGLVAAALASAGLTPDRALVSSAARTRQTWAAAANALSDPPAVFTRALYNAEASEILSEIGREEDAEVLMVVAHNPGVHLLALSLLSQASGPKSVLARLERGYPTASATAFEIDAAGRAQYDGLFLAAELGGGGGE